MHIERNIENNLEKHIHSVKVLVIYGPKQSGKTAVAEKLVQRHTNSQLLDCTDPNVAQQLQSSNLSSLKNVIKNKSIVVFDEAQKISNFGLTLQFLMDSFKDIQIIATGSSSLSLSNSTNKLLTDNIKIFELMPLSILETSKSHLSGGSSREDYLLYGQYPGTFASSYQEKTELLTELANFEAFKDIFNDSLKVDSSIIQKLLTLLSHRLGEEVNDSELSNSLNLSLEITSRYIHLLEEARLIKTIKRYKKDNIDTSSRLKKIYFIDTGLRNAFIKNFSSIYLREDNLALLENQFLLEMMKLDYSNEVEAKYYYWNHRSHKATTLVRTENEEIQVYGIDLEREASKPNRHFIKEFKDLDYKYFSVNIENLFSYFL